MKKFLYSLAAMLLMTGAATMVTSCGDDNDEPDAPSTTKTVKEAQLCLSFYVNSEMAEAYDITGKTADGKEISLSAIPVEVLFQSETARMYALTLEKTADNVPVSASMSVTFTLKEGYNLPEKSNFAYKLAATGTYVYTDGTNSTIAANGIEMQNEGVSAERINEYTASLNKNFGQINANFVSAGIEVDTNSAD